MSASGLTSDQSEPEHRAAVLRLEIAAEEVREQLAVADEVDVDGHARSVGGRYSGSVWAAG